MNPEEIYQEIAKILKNDLQEGSKESITYYIDDELTEEELEQIERYCERQLSPNDLIFFEKKVREEEVFRKRVNSYRIVRELITKKNLGNLQDHLLEHAKALRTDGNDDIKRIDWFSRKYLSIAASILIVITAGIFYISYTSEKTPHDLFVAYYTRPMEGLRSGSDDNVSIRNAIEAYKSENYTAAASYFEQELLERPENMMARFYLGNCYLLTDQSPKAISSLQEVINSDSFYAYDARWYLALAYLETGAIESSKTELQNILKSNAENALKDQAKRLTRELNRISGN